MARFTKALAAVAVLCVAGVATAAIPWTNPSGTALDYDWANGQNSNSNLFGSPSNFGDNNLFFFASNFNAFADDTGTLGSVTDTMDVDLTSHPTKKFLSIAVFEFGDYNITGGAGNSVSADLSMTGTAAHPQSPWSNSFSFGAAGASAGAIAWDDSAELLMQFAVPDLTSVHLTVSNTLVAISDGAGGTASVSGDFVLLGVSVALIPEPASLSLLALGGLALLRRRR